MSQLLRNTDETREGCVCAHMAKLYTYGLFVFGGLSFF